MTPVSPCAGTLTCTEEPDQLEEIALLLAEVHALNLLHHVEQYVSVLLATNRKHVVNSSSGCHARVHIIRMESRSRNVHRKHVVDTWKTLPVSMRACVLVLPKQWENSLGGQHPDRPRFHFHIH